MIPAAFNLPDGCTDADIEGTPTEPERNDDFEEPDRESDLFE